MGRDHHSLLSLPTRPLNPLQVKFHNNDGWPPLNLRREQLELDIFVLEFGKGFRPSGGTASKDQERRHLHSESLVSKNLGIAHPVAILEGAEILHKNPSLVLFRVVKAKGRGEKLRDPLSQSQYNSVQERDKQRTLRMS